MAEKYDESTAPQKLTVEIVLWPGAAGRADFNVPLMAERRYGGYRVTAFQLVRRNEQGSVYRVDLVEVPGMPKAFVGEYEA